LSNVETKTPYEQALSKALALKELLAPACELLAIAGSLRRKKPLIGDLELVAIPKMESILDMFGFEVGQESAVVRVLREQRIVSTGAERMRRFPWLGMTCDLFLTVPERWAQIFLIRTGSVDFSKWVMTRRPWGALPEGMRFDDGYLWRNDLIVPTNQEIDVFVEIGLAWIPPKERSVGPWTKYLSP
jgi:DNA polymerase/3'-5' exonuclease PolX